MTPEPVPLPPLHDPLPAGTAPKSGRRTLRPRTRWSVRREVETNARVHLFQPAVHRLLAVILGAGLAFPVDAQEVRVEAGAHDRERSLVHLRALRPSTLPPAQTSALLDERNRRLAVQWLSDDHAVFVLDRLPRGATTRLRWVAPETNPSTVNRPAMRIRQQQRKWTVDFQGQTLFEYQAEPSDPPPNVAELFRRGGYLHPIYTPSGRRVTDDYPHNHLHHHGVWFPWTKTEFEGRTPDFWNMGQGTGRVEPVHLGQWWSGEVCAGFQADHRFVDLTAPQPRVALTETWTVQAYRIESLRRSYWLLDLVSTQRCATASALHLPQYHYGGLGFRGHGDWDGAAHAYFLTANGETNRVKGHATRARWCYVGGHVQGQQSGVILLDHPGNFRSPQPMRLHPTEPFFCYAPSQLGDWSIEPGKPYVSRYRLAFLDGPPDAAEADRLWHDFAAPPAASLLP